MLFRHGIAEDDGPDGTDASRRLTAEGIERTTHAAVGLTRFADAPDVLLCSPKVRARQTADIVAKAFGMDVVIADELAEGPPDAVAKLLLKQNVDRVMAVGHEPTLSVTADILARGRMGSTIELKKAGCICVRAYVTDLGEWDGGYLRWIATPKMLVALDGKKR